MSSSVEPATSDASREAVKAKIQALFAQMTAGCGQANCENPHCASAFGHPKPPVDAAKDALRLATAGEDATCARLDPFLDLASVQAIITRCATAGSLQELSTAVFAVFSSPDALSHSFLLPPAQRTPDGCNIDFAALKQAYELLEAVPDEGVAGAMRNALDALLSHVAATQQQDASFYRDLRRVRALIVVLLNPVWHDMGTHERLLPLLCRVLSSVPDAARARTIDWLASGDADSLRSAVGALQQFLSVWVLSRDHPGYTATRDRVVLTVALSLEILYEATQRPAVPLVAAEMFQNDAITQNFDLAEDFTAWKRYTRQQRSASGIVSFCDFHFLLRLAVKVEILTVETRILQREEQRQGLFAAMMHGMGAMYLLLNVSRPTLIRDAVTQLSEYYLVDPARLKRRLRVKFEGEDGVDEGGVQKEFFQLIIRDLFDPKFGMFTHNETARCYWFKPTSFEVPEEFRLLGIVLGLALYNNVILDVHFPLAVYKKLLDKPVGLEDLAGIDPDLARGLEQLLAYEGDDVEDLYHRTFVVEHHEFGAVQEVELCPGGAQIALTKANRAEYVRLLVNYHLNTSIAAQFAAFRTGFWSVCEGAALLQMLTPAELELVICGTRELDFTELERVSRVDGYEPTAPVVRWFWEEVRAMTPEEQRQLLSFATGSDRVPVGGLGAMRFIIAKQGPDSDRLPSAHTCFNALLLPEYSSREKLGTLLRKAIAHNEGFGMY